MLNAGNYGVPQSRKRTFIWAAAPEEQLPSWPQQRFVFRSPQLTINLPGGVAYTAVPQQQVGTCPWGVADSCPRGRLLMRQPIRGQKRLSAAWLTRLHPLPQGAPLRTVTVRDAIGDLPIIKNGHDQ